MDTIPNIPSNVQVNVKPAVVLAFAGGTAVGTITMSLYARYNLKKLIKLTDQQQARYAETQKYMMEKMSPHVPQEVLTDILTHLQTNLIAANEEGLEIGVPPKDETTD